MTTIVIRRATVDDLPQMADLLNEIVQVGGTTALTSTVSADELNQWRTAYPADESCWLVAIDTAVSVTQGGDPTTNTASATSTDTTPRAKTGVVVGFQFIEPNSSLPPETVDIATFVKMGVTQKGIGSQLFQHTKVKARTLSNGCQWINATIRSDNVGGLAYYDKQGFVDYDHRPNAQLANGQVVSKTLKRYNLD